jgi:hypothetical protein
VGLQSSWNYGAMLSAGPDASFLVRMPGFDGAVHAGLSLGYLVALPAELQAPGGKTVTRMHNALPLHLEGAWRPLLSEDLSAHLGGAAGVVLSDLTLAPTDGGTPQRSIAMAASAQLVAGIAYRLGPGFLEADLRAGYALPLGGELVGTPLGAALVLGYRFGL